MKEKYNQKLKNKKDKLHNLKEKSREGIRKKLE